MLISPTLRSDLGLYLRIRGDYRESMITLTSCSRTWVGMLIGDFDEWVVRISMIIDWIRNAFNMRVGVHGLKYMEPLNEFFTNRTCFNIGWSSYFRVYGFEHFSLRTR